jgi:DNA polymerase-3 subunit epsilon
LTALLARLFRRDRPVSLRAAQWAVIDCETSGLDPARDRLLSVGAVRVRAGRIEAGPGYCAILHQDATSDPANILVHGIGEDAQRTGRPAREALAEFSQFVEGSVPVAFSAPFDAVVLRRAMKAEGLEAPRDWLDLAQLAPALFPRARRLALDDWLETFAIACPGRHEALGDAYATAQFLLVLLAEAERQGAGTVGALRRLAGSARWVQRP